jgi:hypothetical protein
MTTTIIGVLAALAVLVLTVELLRRRALREKYAVIWLVVSVVAVVFTVFPGLLLRVSQRLGFQIPANFVFAIAALVLLVVGMQLSLEVGRLEDRSQRLAEEVGLLRHDIEQLRREHDVRAENAAVDPHLTTAPTDAASSDDGHADTRPDVDEGGSAVG